MTASDRRAGKGKSIDTLGYDEDERSDQKALETESTYEVIRREGEKELERSTGALFWSGLGAGLSMGFSFLAE